MEQFYGDRDNRSQDTKHSVKTLEAIFHRLAEPDFISHRKFLACMFQDKAPYVIN